MNLGHPALSGRRLLAPAVLALAACAAAPPDAPPAGAATGASPASGDAASAPPSVAARRLLGRYQYMADAGLFTDCASGRRLPVAEEAANAVLQRAYLGVTPAPGEPVMVMIDAYVAPRPLPDQPAPGPAWIVTQVAGVAAGARCP